MCQWLDGFVNAGECSALLDRAKTKLSARKAEVPNLLMKEDFQGKETSTERVREAFTGLQSVWCRKTQLHSVWCRVKAPLRLWRAHTWCSLGPLG